MVLHTPHLNGSSGRPRPVVLPKMSHLSMCFCIYMCVVCVVCVCVCVCVSLMVLHTPLRNGSSGRPRPVVLPNMSHLSMCFCIYMCAVCGVCVACAACLCELNCSTHSLRSCVPMCAFYRVAIKRKFVHVEFYFGIVVNFVRFCNCTSIPEFNQSPSLAPPSE